MIPKAQDLVNHYFFCALSIERELGYVQAYDRLAYFIYNNLSILDPIKAVRAKTEPVLEDLAQSFCARSKDTSFNGFHYYIRGFIDFCEPDYLPCPPTDLDQWCQARGSIVEDLANDPVRRKHLLEEYNPVYEASLVPDKQSSAVKEPASQDPKVLRRRRLDGRKNLPRNGARQMQLFDDSVDVYLVIEGEDRSTSVHRVPMSDDGGDVKVSIN